MLHSNADEIRGLLLHLQQLMQRLRRKKKRDGKSKIYRREPRLLIHSSSLASCRTWMLIMITSRRRAHPPYRTPHWTPLTMRMRLGPAARLAAKRSLLRSHPVMRAVMRATVNLAALAALSDHRELCSHSSGRLSMVLYLL